MALFLVMAAAGISLVFEASAKQTAGVVLLGLAATWLVGSMSLHVLWLLSSLVSCAVGASLVAVPVLNDWKSFQVSIQDYDAAIVDLRQAVASSRISPPASAVSSAKSEPIPSGATLVKLPPAIDYDPLARRWVPGVDISAGLVPKAQQQDRFARNAPPVTITPDPTPSPQQQDRFAQEAARAFDPNAPYQQAGPLPKQNSRAVKGKNQGDIFDQIDQESGGTAKNKPTQGQYTAADIDRTMEIPATTQNWERPDLNLLPLPSGAKLETGSIVTRLSFPSNVAEEELVGTIQNQLLQPRPKFSIKGSLISNRLYSLIGLAFLAAGLFSLGWFVRRVLG